MDCQGGSRYDKASGGIAFLIEKRDLYDAILARRSVRRYDEKPLDAQTLAQVREIAASVRPLILANHFGWILGDVPLGRALVGAVGLAARLVACAHVYVSYISGGKHSLTDLGYRAEQLAVRLVQLGIGSCFIGVIRKEHSLRELLSLSDDTRLGAFLMFGQPSQTLGGRAYDAVVRSMARSHRRMPIARLFFSESWDNSGDVPEELIPLVEAGRHAPSAGNAQPWRFLWKDERLSLFVVRKNRRYPRGYQEDYVPYDGGICMGNISLAMEALGIKGHWIMYEGQEPDVRGHPEDLLPLARLVLGEEEANGH